MWLALKEAISQSIEETQKLSRDSKKPWITTDTLRVIKARKDLKASNIDTEHKHKEYSRLTRQIQTLYRKDKNIFIQGVCEKLETHSEHNNSKDLFQKIRVLTRKFRTKTWLIKDSDGVIRTEIDQVVEIWQQYCERLLENDQTSQENQDDF